MKHLYIKTLFFTAFVTVVSSAFTGHPIKGKHKKVSINDTLKIYKDPQVTAFFKREAGWIAADGAYSFPIGDGKVLWTFGDTFTNDYDPKNRNCSLSFQCP